MLGKYSATEIPPWSLGLLYRGTISNHKASALMIVISQKAQSLATMLLMIQFQQIRWSGHHIPELVLCDLSLLLVWPSLTSTSKEEAVIFKFVSGEPQVISYTNECMPEVHSF